jgi:hypothetical protein
LRDSQAGQCCGRKLGLFLGSNDKQDDSSHQRESSEDWGNGHSVMLFCCGVNRPGIQDFFLVRVSKSLISKRQAAENDKQNSEYYHWFHSFSVAPKLRVFEP